MGLAAFAPRETITALARAFGGAILFGLPLLMTMEMWSLGGYIERPRLVGMVLVNIPLLVALSHYIGFEPTARIRDDVADAFVAYAVAFVASAVVLALFGEIDPAMSLDEITGKLVVQAVPGSMGAALAAKELGGDDDDDEHAVEQDPTYPADLFYMVAGALFMAFNMAPTEEMILIAFQMSRGQPLVLALISLGLMHVFVYAVEFRGQHSRPPGMSLAAAFLRYTVVGYALVLLVSVYVLWTFGRLDGVSIPAATSIVVVLSFPGAIGAAAARLIL
ncbi:MAG TPA: TIGR02587 family membrane protein [Kofleriaceae bacterium]|nr:TIGR02587 family membrane protein [Kofleriaceae bacterium]